MRARKWLDERRMLNELVREAREIEDILNAAGAAPNLRFDNGG
jgi:hypothetical protein